MLAPGAASAGGLFASDFAESDVRRLCGQARFEEADALQRARHVREPRVQEGALQARVQGTWRREFVVTIGGRGTDLLPGCACGAGGFCRHVGALLLHALRAPDAFAIDDDPGGYASPGSASPATAIVTPQAELEHWFEQLPMADLRDRARRWGLRIRARTKAEYVPQLAEAMADPAAVDRMLARQSASDRLALSATYILNAAGAIDDEHLREAVTWLGGAASQLDLESLVESNLLVLGWVTIAGRNRHGYVVPHAVVSRLPPLALASDREELDHPPAPAASNDGDVIAWMLALAQTVLAGTSQPGSRITISGDSGSGWRLTPRPGDAPDDGPQAEVQLRSLTFGSGFEPIAERVGASPLALEFALRLLLGLDILHAGKHATLDERALRDLLALAPPARRARLAMTWAAMPAWVDLAPLLGPSHGLRIGGMVPAIGQVWPYAAQRVLQSRYLLGRLIGSITPGVWYRLPAVLRRLRDLLRIAGLAESIRWAAAHPALKGKAISWIRASDGTRQDLADRTAWEGFLLALAEAQLRGPLCWLGLTEIAAGADGDEVIRLHPAAGVLARREPPAEPEHAAPPLVLESDGTVAVPPAAGGDIYNLLGRAAELEGLSSTGLRYRLTSSGVQHLFDDGMSAADLLATLERQAGKPAPPEMRASIERWWDDYGAIRLYDDVTLIELADDFLLPQLLAATSLGQHLVQQITPRLLAVSAGGVDALVGELTRLGLQPRVVEEG